MSAALTPEQEALQRIARHVENFQRLAPDYGRRTPFESAQNKLFLIGCIARDTLAEALEAQS